MANRADNVATSTEVIPAGHAVLTAEDELGEHQSDTSAGLAGIAGSFYLPSRARGSACRRGYGVLRTGEAAPQSTICKKRVAASSRIELADPRRRGGILRCLYKSTPGCSSTSHAVSGQRAACEPSFAHPTMQSPQKSLAPDEPKYLPPRRCGQQGAPMGFRPMRSFTVTPGDVPIAARRPMKLDVLYAIVVGQAARCWRAIDRLRPIKLIFGPGTVHGPKFRRSVSPSEA
jgi:hypothetical protein